MKDKAAITKAAQKYVAKGQIDKALAEWEKLKTEEKDVNTYNIIGDLYLKKGSKREAIESFTMAAKIFREDGFYLKAMALYKKILYISPSEVDALLALAELNAEKGLIGSAIGDFLAVADLYIKEDLIEKALEIYEKALQLTPSNINLKLKIADLYLDTGLKQEAAKEYAAIASGYLEKKESGKAQEFYIKTIDIDPQNIPSLIALGKIAEEANDVEKAFEYLKNAFSFAPDNKDVLLSFSMLADKTDNVDEAKEVYSRLLEIDPSNVQAKKLLGSIYLNEGLLEKAWDELLPYIDDALLAEKWDDALEFLDNFKELYPVPVKSRFVSAYKGKGDKDAAANELKELAKLYEDKDLHNSALQSYKEFLELIPEDESTISKIKELENTLGLEPPPPVTTPLEEQPIADATIIPLPPEKVEIPLQEGEHVSLEAFKERNADEADFYAQQGFKDDATIPLPPKKVEIPPQEGETVSPEDFKERKAEADFYAQQGFKDDAIKTYESLLSISPGNEEIEKKLEDLKSAPEPEAKPAEEKSLEITPAQSTVYSDDITDILDEFKKGIEKELGEHDAETHYNLGIAYKEMGLLEDAIKEFQLTAKDPEETLRSSSMLALCYAEKGAYPLAINELQKVIEVMSPADEEYLNVKYDLAETYEKNKENDNALKVYTEIYTKDPEFRDVAHKAGISKTDATEAKDKPRSKKDRVSYI